MFYNRPIFVRGVKSNGEKMKTTLYPMFVSYTLPNLAYR